MKIALAHDFLVKWGGAEKVLFDLQALFPKAPIYTLFYNQKFVQKHFPNSNIIPSGLQRRYRLFKRYHWLMPFIPPAVESLDFSDYDIVISSSSAFLKGIIVPTKTKHICYLHTPTRWAWQDYHFLNLGPLKRFYLHGYRIWDYEAAQRPDILLANSYYTRKRIEKYYNRDSKVIYPSTEIDSITKENSEIKAKYKKYFIILSRVSSYKRIDWAIEAIKKTPFNLVIAGEGKELKKYKSKIKDSQELKNKIFFTGFIDNYNDIMRLIKGSLGLIHLAEEDFGLSMLEALKLGKPVIGYCRGGATEMVQNSKNGYLIKQPSDLNLVLKKCSEYKFSEKDIRKTVKNFKTKTFEEQIKKIINETIK